MATLEDKKKALEKRFVESRPPLAYAKLSGRVADDKPFEMLITHLPVELGRGALSSAVCHSLMLQIDCHKWNSQLMTCMCSESRAEAHARRAKGAVAIARAHRLE